MHGAFQITNTQLVVPIAMTSIEGGVYLTEFKAVRRDELASFKELELAADKVYELVPMVKGV